MKVGDLAKTIEGNLVVIIGLHRSRIADVIEYCDVICSATGHLKHIWYANLAPIEVINESRK